MALRRGGVVNASAHPWFRPAGVFAYRAPAIASTHRPSAACIC